MVVCVWRVEGGGGGTTWVLGSVEILQPQSIKAHGALALPGRNFSRSGAVEEHIVEEHEQMYSGAFKVALLIKDRDLEVTVLDHKP